MEDPVQSRAQESEFDYTVMGSILSPTAGLFSTHSKRSVYWDQDTVFST